MRPAECARRARSSFSSALLARLNVSRGDRGDATSLSLPLASSPSRSFAGECASSVLLTRARRVSIRRADRSRRARSSFSCALLTRLSARVRTGSLSLAPLSALGLSHNGMAEGKDGVNALDALAELVCRVGGLASLDLSQNGLAPPVVHRLFGALPTAAQRGAVRTYATSQSAPGASTRQRARRLGAAPHCDDGKAGF